MLPGSEEMSTPRKSRAKSIGQYVLAKTIGEGTFGKVKLGTHILTGEQVAVKVLEKERIVDVADVERVAREIHILKLIRHPHIIQLYEIIETPRQLYLIMEYASGGELFDYIVQQGRAQEPEACRFLHQILAGVEKVHAERVVHRDLKPENLLLDDRRDIKIVDFGLSNTYDDHQLLQTACGSPCYAAPEMIAGHKYVPSMVDIWSCGVILFALVCGYLPFEDQNHAELYKKILNAEYEMPDCVSKEVADLIAGMLTTDPARRMTLNDIRMHTWYRQMPEASLQDPEDAKTLDEDILARLQNLGFPRDYATKCLRTNKHNTVTTTYYLLKEMQHRKQAEGLGSSTNLQIADLEAIGLEDGPEDGVLISCGHELPGAPPALLAPPAAVAAVATPSRASRRDAYTPSSGRRWGVGGVWNRCPTQSWPAGEPVRTPPPEGTHGPPRCMGPVPKLNFGALTADAVERRAGTDQDAHRCSSARGSHRLHGLWDQGHPSFASPRTGPTHPYSAAPQTARARGRSPRGP